MLRCGSDWRPKRVDRVIETFPTSTFVAKVKTDAGVGYLKGIGNPAGTGSLASELVGSELAALVGLNVPPFALVNVDDIQIPLGQNATVEFGPAFISKEVKAEPGAAGDMFVKRLTRAEDLALLVVFDTWVRNGDRCPPADYLDPTPRRDNLLFAPNGRTFDLVVLDHTHCFTEGDLETDIDGVDVDDSRIYGLFPEFMPHLSDNAIIAAIGRLANVTNGDIKAAVELVPPAWGLTQNTRDKWVQMIVARRDKVGATITAALVAQRNLWA